MLDMQIAKGVEMLEISTMVMGKVDIIYPTLIWDADEVILVDTGLPGQMPLIRAAVEKAGVSFAALTKIIITHQDVDHIGSLPVILAEATQKIEVLSSELERPFIQGEQRLLKITPEAIAQALESLPPTIPDEVRKAFRAVLENPPKANVDRTVADGEELPDCGGIVVIIMPGHTPGHACLYHKASKTLIAGDMLNILDGQLVGPDPKATIDLDLARKSLNKLAQYEITRVISYHGGLYQGDVNQRVMAIIEEV